MFITFQYIFCHRCQPAMAWKITKHHTCICPNATGTTFSDRGYTVGAIFEYHAGNRIAGFLLTISVLILIGSWYLLYREELNHRYRCPVKWNLGISCNWVMVNIIHILNSEHIKLEISIYGERGLCNFEWTRLRCIVSRSFEMNIMNRDSIWCLLLVPKTWFSYDHSNTFRNRVFFTSTFQWSFKGIYFWWHYLSSIIAQHVLNERHHDRPWFVVSPMSELNISITSRPYVALSNLELNFSLVMLNFEKCGFFSFSMDSYSLSKSVRET